MEIKELLERHEQLQSQVSTLKEDNQNLRAVLEQLCHLNRCEQEGIPSGMPLPEDWFKTFLKAEQILKSE